MRYLQFTVADFFDFIPQYFQYIINLESLENNYNGKRFEDL